MTLLDKEEESNVLGYIFPIHSVSESRQLIVLGKIKSVRIKENLMELSERERLLGQEVAKLLSLHQTLLFHLLRLKPP